MNRIVCGIILCIIAVLFLPLGIWLGLKYPSSYEFTGKTLMTEQQYNQFKSECASPNIAIVSVSVLDSGYPTLVTFDIVDEVDAFPFGARSVNAGGLAVLALLAIPTALAGGIILMKEFDIP